MKFLCIVDPGYRDDLNEEVERTFKELPFPPGYLGSIPANAPNYEVRVNRRIGQPQLATGLAGSAARGKTAVAPAHFRKPSATQQFHLN